MIIIIILLFIHLTYSVSLALQIHHILSLTSAEGDEFQMAIFVLFYLFIKNGLEWEMWGWVDGWEMGIKNEENLKRPQLKCACSRFLDQKDVSDHK